jgi:hypothetical protein
MIATIHECSRIWMAKATQIEAAAKRHLRSKTRASVDAFIERVFDERGRRIRRNAIWRVAGYKDATEFERFQRDDERSTPTAKDNFNRVLGMKSERFLELLDNKK